MGRLLSRSLGGYAMNRRTTYFIQNIASEYFRECRARATAPNVEELHRRIIQGCITRSRHLPLSLIKSLAKLHIDQHYLNEAARNSTAIPDAEIKATEPAEIDATASSGSEITCPPGSIVRDLFKWFLPPKTIRLLIDPKIADWQEAWFDAKDQPMKMRVIRIRLYIDLLLCVCAYAPLRALSKLIRSSFR